MPETSTFRRSGSDVVQRQYQIPGYTGFIRNAEEVQGGQALLSLHGARAEQRRLEARRR
jgi:hypothetical protein